MYRPEKKRETKNLFLVTLLKLNLNVVSYYIHLVFENILASSLFNEYSIL